MRNISIAFIIIFLLNSCVSKKSLNTSNDIESSMFSIKKKYNRGANTLGLTFSFGTAAAGAYYANDKNLFVTTDKEGNKITNNIVNSVIGGALGFGVGTFITYLLTPSSNKMHKNAEKNFLSNNYDKAEKYYIKSFIYAENPYSDVIHKSYFGLGQIQEKKLDYKLAERFTLSAHERSKENLIYKYHLARYAATYDKNKAYDWLFRINDYNFATSIGKKAYFSEPLFKNLQKDGKFYRWCNGYRRLKLTINSSFVNFREWGLYPDADQFITVSNNVNGQRNLLLATNEKPNSNHAYWNNFGDYNFVIFDNILGEPIVISQYDADITIKHNFIGYIPLNLSEYGNEGNYTNQKGNGEINFTLSDTDDDVFTSNLSIPHALSLSEIFWSGVLLYSGYKFGNKLFNSADAKKEGFFNTCDYTTNNNTDLFILSIGTDPVVGAEKDAISLTEKLKESCGDSHLFGNIFDITLTNTNATKINISNALYQIKEKTNTDDIFLLSFSGHGGVINDKFAFNTTDGDFIFIDDIIQGINVDGCKSILWFDACRSGKAKNDFINMIDDYIRSRTCPNLSVLMSSSDNQFSYGNQIEGGIFTNTIISGLSGDADANGNGVISLEELERFVIKKVPENASLKSVTQNPQILKEGYDAFNTRLTRYK